MMLNRFYRLFCLAAFTLLGLHCHAGEKNSPNILFFLIDDLGAMDLSVQGSTFYETPAVDRLAADGMRFTQAYAAHPRCVPSRHAIMTGKFPARGGVPGGSKIALSLEEVTLAEALQAGGYRTFFTGKWHLGKDENYYPEKQGFHMNIGGGAAGAPRSYFAPYNVGAKPYRNRKPPIQAFEDAPKGEYLTDRLTDETIKFLKENGKKPFFAFVSHYAVHDPLEAKDDLIKKYSDKAVETDFGAGPKFIDEGSGQTKMKQDNAVYAGMIHSMDESVKRILATLDELGLTENTIVIFTSDHGGLSNRGYKKRKLATSNQPLRAGKGWCYEGGIRVPLIVKWPGVVKPGGRSDALVTGTDFYPTLLKAAGLSLKPGQHLDGEDFTDALRQDRKKQRGAMFWHSPKARPHSTGDANCTAIRVGDYKLIDWYDDNRLELFNIVKDPREQHNLADSMPEKRDKLYEKIKGWRKEVNAYIDPAPLKKTKR